MFLAWEEEGMRNNFAGFSVSYRGTWSFFVVFFYCAFSFASDQGKPDHFLAAREDELINT